MAIIFDSNIESFSLPNPKKVEKWICSVVQSCAKRVGEINYLFCNDEYLLQVNQSYLDHDTYTDIITFDYVEGNLISGDILISVDRVGENAKLFSTDFEHELLRVIVHGIWHLLGQADKSDKDAVEMRKKEEQALALWETIV